MKLLKALPRVSGYVRATGLIGRAVFLLRIQMSNVTTELSLTPGCQRLGLGYWQKTDPRAQRGWFVRHGVCGGGGAEGVDYRDR